MTNLPPAVCAAAADAAAAKTTTTTYRLPHQGDQRNHHHEARQEPSVPATLPVNVENEKAGNSHQRRAERRPTKHHHAAQHLPLTKIANACALVVRSWGRLTVGTPRAHATPPATGRLGVVRLLFGCIEGHIGSVERRRETETRRSGGMGEWIQNPLPGRRLLAALVLAAPVAGPEQQGARDDHAAGQLDSNRRREAHVERHRRHDGDRDGAEDRFSSQAHAGIVSRGSSHLRSVAW